MKNRITAILLILAATLAFNGVMAQSPESGTKTDREFQLKDDNLQHGTYNQRKYKRKQSHSGDRRLVVRKNRPGKKSEVMKTTGPAQTGDQKIRDRKKGRERAVKHETRVRRSKMKMKKHYFKKQAGPDLHRNGWLDKVERGQY
jgi:hypothetical protein